MQENTGELSPCPGCGVLYPPDQGPVHRYYSASPGCWALFSWSAVAGDVSGLLAQSMVSGKYVRVPAQDETPVHDTLWGSAYGVQHGTDTPRAIQSVALQLLNMYGIISGRTTHPRWPMVRAIRSRGVFHYLSPPAPGCMLTIRHLFPGGGVATPVTRGQYVASVYEAWMALHGSTIERWYDRYVEPDRLTP